MKKLQRAERRRRARKVLWNVGLSAAPEKVARTVAGVDAFRGHLLAVIERDDGSRGVEFFASFAELVEREELELIVIDMPIGLPDTGARADARDRPRRANGRRCSWQLYSILDLVRDVNTQMTPSLQRRVREGHPEVSFATLNGGVPLEHPRATPAGRAERIALLQPQYPEIRSVVERFARRAALPDLLDAYVLLWTSRRTCEDEVIRLPVTSATLATAIPSQNSHQRNPGGSVRASA